MLTIIRNGSVWTGDTFVQKDLHIMNGYIHSLSEPGLSVRADEIIDAKGQRVIPGFVDPHVHFNEPGRSEWEGIRTGSAAAAAGGITTFIDMPLNSHPSVTSGPRALAKSEALKEKSYVDYGLWGGITSENCRNGHFLDEQIENGVLGFKGFMAESGISDFGFLDRQALREATAYCGEHHTILLLHAESQEEIDKLAHLNGPKRTSFLAGRSAEAELRAIDWIVEDALRYQTPIHVVHVSTADGIRMLNEGKRSGADVTIETCPHYLLFTDEDFIRVGPLLKCAPPLRSSANQDELWDLVEQGWIDMIGSDHSPCPLPMKQAGNQDIRKAWGGIQGVQFGHMSFLSEGLKRGIPYDILLPMMTKNPAERFLPDHQKGVIAPEHPADLVIIQDRETQIHNTDILFKHKASPYEGMTVHLDIERILFKGSTIYQGGAWVTGPPSGEQLKRGGIRHDTGTLRRVHK